MSVVLVVGKELLVNSILFLLSSNLLLFGNLESDLLLFGFLSSHLLLLISNHFLLLLFFHHSLLLDKIKLLLVRNQGFLVSLLVLVNVHVVHALGILLGHKLVEQSDHILILSLATGLGDLGLLGLQQVLLVVLGDHAVALLGEVKVLVGVVVEFLVQVDIVQVVSLDLLDNGLMGRLHDGVAEIPHLKVILALLLLIKVVSVDVHVFHTVVQVEAGLLHELKGSSIVLTGLLLVVVLGGMELSLGSEFCVLLSEGHGLLHQLAHHQLHGGIFLHGHLVSGQVTGGLLVVHGVLGLLGGRLLGQLGTGGLEHGGSLLVVHGRSEELQGHHSSGVGLVGVGL